MAYETDKEKALPHLTMDESKFFKKKMKSGIVRTGVQGLFHPLHFSKVLIQTGYEPFALTKGKLYWVAGPDGYCLPNGLRYAANIASKEGIAAVYRGLPVAMVSGVVGTFGTTLGLIWLDRHHPYLKEKVDYDPMDLHAAFKAMSRKAIREASAKTVGTILASPFRVVLVRRIAAYIGGEVEYDTLVGGLKHVVREEGYKGLFKGLVPLLIAEWGTVWLLHTFSLAVDQVYIRFSGEALPPEPAEDEEEEEDARAQLANISSDMEGAKGLRKLAKFALPFIVNGITYRYHLFSTVMTINACGLAAGAMPYAPAFETWQEAQDWLKLGGGLKRGAKLFFRDYLGPITYRGLHAYASL